MLSKDRPAALVTGGAVRLGKAIALDLAQSGYDIALHYNSSIKPAEKTAEAIERTGVACVAFRHDLQDASGLEELVRGVHREFPRLSVLINSASSYDSGKIQETTPATFDTQLAVNLRAPFFLMQAFAATVQRGNVVNIIDNKIGFNQYQYAAYLLSKKALVELTRMAALEYAPQVRVNGVAPGVVLPADSRSADYVAWRVQGIPVKQQGSPEHITQTIRFLLENNFMTGQIIVVDGGENIDNVGQNALSYGQTDQT
jgi:NAD(P)-dependent dehydrogenase (short-subunit alcohol dehydrogenase family)